MKSLKINHDFATKIQAGKAHYTWRINDDKDIHVNDQVQLIDKLNEGQPSSNKAIGIATITSILEKQIGKITKSDMEADEEFTSTDDLLKTFRGYYGPQVNPQTPLKMIRFDYKDIDLASEQTAGVKEAKMYSDGGSRGNPGPSACGYVLYTMDDVIIIENGSYLGVTTNNQAEYQSLKTGLEEAVRQGINILHVHMDSLLVVNQMKRIFKIKNQDLLPLYNSVVELTKNFEKISFTHVPRERNKRADSLVNQVLDTINS